jgi:predicted XRE-type DNA-binding protein
MKTKTINLTRDEREKLETFTRSGIHSVRLVKRAKIILELDELSEKKTKTQNAIAQKVEVSRQAVNDTKNAFLNAKNIDEFLTRKKRETPPVEAKMTGEVEAHIIALACSNAPQGSAKWTLRLLADKSVELGYVDSLSHMSVSRLLKKHNLSLI